MCSPLILETIIRVILRRCRLINNENSILKGMSLLEEVQAVFLEIQLTMLLVIVIFPRQREIQFIVSSL